MKVPTKVTDEMVRTATHLCPLELTHLDKVRWMADHINKAMAAAAPQQGGEENIEGFYEKLWKDFVSIQRGNAAGVCERVERYYREMSSSGEASRLPVHGAVTPVAWVIAVEEYSRMVVYGPQYTNRQSAELDAKLPQARGVKTEIWACYQGVVSPPAPLAMSAVEQGQDAELIKELEWMSEQYDDTRGTGTLASRLYDVSCTARKLLATRKFAPVAQPVGREGK